MQIKTTQGQTVDVCLEEITGVATALGWEKHSSAEHSHHSHEVDSDYNSHYTNNALKCIEHMTGVRPTTEQELKELMFHHLHLGSQEETNLLYECIEAIVGWHSMYAHKA